MGAARSWLTHYLCQSFVFHPLCRPLSHHWSHQGTQRRHLQWGPTSSPSKVSVIITILFILVVFIELIMSWYNIMFRQSPTICPTNSPFDEPQLFTHKGHSVNLYWFYELLSPFCRKENNTDQCKSTNLRQLYTASIESFNKHNCFAYAISHCITN